MIRLLLLVSLLHASASVAGACNIPVFRYALERWSPDPCRVMVFYDRELSRLQEQKVAALEAHCVEQGGLANATVIRCLVSDKMEADQRTVYDSLRQERDVAVPYVVLRTTVGNARGITHWQGTLDHAVDANLFDSPARSELAQRLLSGDSVVWLVLKSTNERRTSDASKMLKNNFKTLLKSVRLPDGIGLPGSELHSEVPLWLKFSVLEIDPADPKEKLLIDLLTGFQPGAVKRGDPLLVPVFGRGRALEVIPAEDLDAHLMADLTMFLSAACSCQVKERNPGFDLLLSADWDTVLFGEDGVRPPPAKTVGDRARSPVLLTIPPGRRE